MNGVGDDADEGGEPPVPSPCISLCVMDRARRYCLGCRRTLGEIASWGALTNEAKRAVLTQLPVRQ